MFCDISLTHNILYIYRVKQPSACCGAAAVAGALNCLGSMNRKHPCALTHIDILNIYRTIVANSIVKKKTSFERCLGAPVDEFLSRLEADVFSSNVEQARKRYATSKKEVLSSVRRLIAADKEGKADPQQEEGSQAAQMSAACNLLDELLASERKEEEEQVEVEGGVEVVMIEGSEEVGGRQGINVPDGLVTNADTTHPCTGNSNSITSTAVKKKQQQVSGDSSSSADSASCIDEVKQKQREEEAKDEEARDEEKELSGHAAAIIVIPGKKPKSVKRRPKKNTKFSKFTNGGKRSGDGEDEGGGEEGGAGLVHNSWEWQKSLCEIVKKLAGLRKLEADKPSTACIGNWGILAGVQQLLELTDIGSACLSAKLFMGKGLAGPRCKVQVPLARRDSCQQVTVQWNALRSAFADPNQVLLFHLKNHYALIFAVREWTVRGEGSDTTGEGSDNDEQSAGAGAMHIVREMYTARRGQRPAVWVDFSEARETMLAWEGYKIMSLQRQQVEQEGGEAEAVAKLRSVKGLLEQHFPAQAWNGYLRHT